MSLKTRFVFWRTSGALSMFAKAIERLHASNELAKKIIKDNENKITKLALEKDKVHSNMLSNSKVISNIENLLKG